MMKKSLSLAAVVCLATAPVLMASPAMAATTDTSGLENIDNVTSHYYQMTREMDYTLNYTCEDPSFAPGSKCSTTFTFKNTSPYDYNNVSISSRQMGIDRLAVDPVKSGESFTHTLNFTIPTGEKIPYYDVYVNYSDATGIENSARRDLYMGPNDLYSGEVVLPSYSPEDGLNTQTRADLLLRRGDDGKIYYQQHSDENSLPGSILGISDINKDDTPNYPGYFMKGGDSYISILSFKNIYGEAKTFRGLYFGGMEMVNNGSCKDITVAPGETVNCYFEVPVTQDDLDWRISPWRAFYKMEDPNGNVEILSNFSSGYSSDRAGFVNKITATPNVDVVNGKDSLTYNVTNVGATTIAKGPIFSGNGETIRYIGDIEDLKRGESQSFIDSNVPVNSVDPYYQCVDWDFSGTGGTAPVPPAGGTDGNQPVCKKTELIVGNIQNTFMTVPAGIHHSFYISGIIGDNTYNNVYASQDFTMKAEVPAKNTVSASWNTNYIPQNGWNLTIQNSKTNDVVAEKENISGTAKTFEVNGIKDGEYKVVLTNNDSKESKSDTVSIAAANTNTPMLPTIVDKDGVKDDSVTAPANTATITYVLTYNNVTGKWSLTATPVGNATLTPNSSEGWVANGNGSYNVSGTLNIKESNVDVDLLVSPATPTIVDMPGYVNDKVTAPKDTAGVKYSLVYNQKTGVWTLTATAQDGYVFADGSKTAIQSGKLSITVAPPAESDDEPKPPTRVDTGDVDSDSESGLLSLFVGLMGMIGLGGLVARRHR